MTQELHEIGSKVHDPMLIERFEEIMERSDRHRIENWRRKPEGRHNSLAADLK